MRKSLCFLVSLLPAVGLAESTEETTKLFSEYVSESLAEHGVETGFSFSGELNGSAIGIRQGINAKDGAPDNCAATLEGDVYIDYRGKADGFGYGLQIGNKVKSGLLKQGSAIVDSSYVFVETDSVGQVKFGYTNSAADSFSVCYGNVLTGYSSADSGNLSTFYAQTSGSIIGTGFDRDDDKCLKVVWLSPVVSGWSCGLSYSSNTRDGHLFKENRNKIEKDYSPRQNFADQTAYSKDNITCGVAYEYGDPEAFNIKISLSGWCGTGCADYTSVRNIRAYNIATIVGYKDWKLALSYTDGGKSMLPVAVVDERNDRVGFCSGADAGKIYTAGLSYTYDKLEASLGYFHAVKKISSHERSNANIASAAIQWNVDRVFSVYVEYDNIRTRTCQRFIDTERASDGFAYGNNHANMVVIGTKIKI